MSEDDKARPVSGEIMTGGSAQVPVRRETADFTDAEYETVATGREPETASFAEAEPAAGMDFLRAGTKAVEDGPTRGGPLFWMTGLTLVVLAFWVSGGHALVRQQVAALAPTEMREPLRIGEVKSRVERHNGGDVLFVDGRAENHGPAALPLPPIEMTVTAGDGGTVRYFLGTSGTELAPGDRYSFSSRLEAPVNGVKSVSVTFKKDAR